MPLLPSQPSFSVIDCCHHFYPFSYPLIKATMGIKAQKGEFYVWKYCE